MLRINLLVVMTLLYFPFSGIAKESADSLFVKANKEYAQKDYETAATTYQKVLDAGIRTSSIYYNLGNTHYRLNNLASAILNYERAHRISPNDDDVNANLRFANSKISDKMEVVPELFLKRWWTSFLLLLSVQSWSVFGVLSLLLGFVGLVIYLFSLKVELKRFSFYIGLVLIFLGVCCISFAGAEESYLQAHKEAIVFNGVVNVKISPDIKQKTLMVIHEGTKVRIIEPRENWLKVELPNGNIGWVEAAALQLI
jgi:tetratricopeptide (TPR) repeat protein